MGAQEARLRLDGFLEETGAFGQSFLLKPYRNRISSCNGPRKKEPAQQQSAETA